MVNFPRSIPQPIRDPFDFARNVVAGNQNELPGFNSPVIPSKSGFGTRQSRIASGRTGHPTRNMVRWFVPETGIVEMYINPQSIKWNDKKDISKVRTKNGFVLQYWGEDLGTMSIQGTTGSSGVEGINVLYDVYRNEQVSFDPYALALAAARDQQDLSEVLPGDGNILGNFLGIGGESLADSVLNQTKNLFDSAGSSTTRPVPTLASLAFQVEMYWSGWVFRGYFTDFSFDEAANRIGLFEYNFNFTVTQRRGLRTNFFAWHRSPTDGPSDSSPERRGGVPYSFTRLGGPLLPRRDDPNEGVRSVDAALLQSSRPLMGDR